jgi:endonuclease/exonuclease/phosphatase (EEP) superfamily protein YafD
MRVLRTLSYKRLLGWSIWAYALGMLVFYGVFLTSLTQWWVFQAINTFGLWLYLPLVFLVPLALLVWRKQAAIILVIPMLGFLIEYQWCLVPKSTPAGPTSLKLMTWNVRPDNPSPQTIQQTILAQRPEVVALQELFYPLAKPLGPLLKREYPYQLLGADDGLALYSRYPLQPLVTEPSPACRCLPALVTLPKTVTAKPVALVNVHLPIATLTVQRLGPIPMPTDFNTHLQDGFLQGLLQRVEAITQPFVVMGDFNIGDRQPNYQKLRAYLTDAFTQVGWGFGLTYPVNRLTHFPVVRIDYVWHNPQWRAKQIRHGQAPGSDHKYTVAELQLLAR